MLSVAEENKPHFLIRVVKGLALPAAIGFVVGLSFSLANNAFDWELGSLLNGVAIEAVPSVSSVVAAVIGGLLVLISLVIAVGCFFPGYGIKSNIFADRQDWEDQRGLHLMSSLGCLGWGALMVTLALVEPLELSVGPALISVLAVSAAMLAYSCWRLLREFDELWHDLNQAMCTWAFYGALVIGGGWSALAHLSLVPALAPLDWVSLLTLLSLTGSIIANGQRGIFEEHF